MDQPQVLMVAPAAVVTALVLDLALGGDVGLLFGLSFVTGCVALGLQARLSDLFVAAVVPPLLMLGCLLAVGITTPAALGVPAAGPVTGVIAGFAHHSWALGLGYVLCLAGLGARLAGASAVPIHPSRTLQWTPTSED